jgi:glycosyltransferase involved in cell wall biosynthesis
MNKNKSTRFVNLADPLVSVIVPIYNRFNFLVLTLDSLKNQSYKNIQVICVNDGGESAEKYIKDLNDSRFEYYEHDVNKKLSATRNTALKYADGMFLSLLDSDDIYMKYSVEFRMYMMKKLKAEIVFTRSLQNIMDKVKLDNGQEVYQTVSSALYWNSDFSKDLICVQNVAPCCNVTFSRKSWELANYWFDETMTSSEDHDFWVALSRRTNFVPLDLIDTECSLRRDGTNMTGTINFVPNWIKIFKRWRPTAENLEWVTESQNSILKRVGINPSDYGL